MSWKNKNRRKLSKLFKRCERMWESRGWGVPTHEDFIRWLVHNKYLEDEYPIEGQSDELISIQTLHKRGGYIS